MTTALLLVCIIGPLPGLEQSHVLTRSEVESLRSATVRYPNPDNRVHASARAAICKRAFGHASELSWIEPLAEGDES